MGEKSCQPFGLQPKRPLTLSGGSLIFAISASPPFALSTVLAATHTRFIMLGTLKIHSIQHVSKACDAIRRGHAVSVRLIGPDDTLQVPLRVILDSIQDLRCAKIL